MKNTLTFDISLLSITYLITKKLKYNNLLFMFFTKRRKLINLTKEGNIVDECVQVIFFERECVQVIDDIMIWHNIISYGLNMLIIYFELSLRRFLSTN